MRFFATTCTGWRTATGALLLLLSTAVGLVGCGRKSGLDPPPLAAPVPVEAQPAAVPPGAPGGPPLAPAPPAR